MACCSTIYPLNSSQKRSSSGVFDMPKTAKRRRPFGSTNQQQLSTSLTNSISISSSSNNNNSPNTMFTTTSSILNSSNKPIVIEANDSSSSKKQSVFNAQIPFANIADSSSSDEDENSQFNKIANQQTLMDRIKMEAKRMNKRKPVNLSVITNSLSINPSETSSTTLNLLPANDLNNNSSSKLIEKSLQKPSTSSSVGK